MLTYGSMFSGYGGLDAGVQSVLGGTASWFAEFEKAPSKILAHHWPDVPNLGDVTKIDWASVPKVDVITGGSPCQDLSHAGKRAGMTTGTRSNLWGEMRDAVAVLRPKLVVWENVRGAYSACADSDMGRCPRCVGENPKGKHAPWLRALGRVLGDLSDLGYDARWYGFRAADVGAPHGRFRVFVFANPAGDPWRFGNGDDEAAAIADRVGGERGWPARDGWGGSADHGLAPADPGSKRHGCREDGRALGRVDGRDAGETRQRERAREVPGDRDATDWGQYGPTIHRWEHILRRVAPRPTETGPKGGQRLSPAFVEFMMGLPEGHVTDVDISRNEQLKALGNGVVPQQAAAATAMWLRDTAIDGAALVAA